MGSEMCIRDRYGKFTWKIENFSEISKRELRSNVFEVGGYKWYILVYPQGCDVSNHLSLFLCVADYDKLLPGWSHFAQFTIAVVNKDPKSPSTAIRCTGSVRRSTTGVGKSLWSSRRCSTVSPWRTRS